MLRTFEGDRTEVATLLVLVTFWMVTSFEDLPLVCEVLGRDLSENLLKIAISRDLVVVALLTLSLGEAFWDGMGILEFLRPIVGV